jgi:hypothetical protein
MPGQPTEQAQAGRANGGLAASGLSAASAVRRQPAGGRQVRPAGRRPPRRGRGASRRASTRSCPRPR